MQRSLVPIFCLLGMLLTTGTALADDPTTEPPRPARFQAWLPFVRTARLTPPLRLTTESRLGGLSSGVAIAGDRGYQVQGGRLLVWDLADMDAATVIGQVDLPWADAAGRVTVGDGITVVLQQRQCGSVSPSDPAEVRTKPCVQAAIIDARDGRAPTLRSTIPIGGQSALMSRWGDRLYVAATIDEDGLGADPSMLLAYDLTQPAVPVLTGRLDGLPVIRQLVAGADLVAASGTKGDGSSRLLLFETRLGRPRLQRDLSVGNSEVDRLRDVAHLRVVDLADPTHPALIDSIEFPLADTSYLYASTSRLLASGWFANQATIAASWSRPCALWTSALRRPLSS